MDSLSHKCLNRAYIDQDAFADQEEYVRTLCAEWIEDLYKMNAYAEAEVIEHNLLQINTMFALGIIKILDERKYFPPPAASINNIADLTEFRKLRAEAKPLMQFMVNCYYKKIGTMRFCLVFNTLRNSNMLNNIDTIRRKSTIDGVLQNLPIVPDGA